MAISEKELLDKKAEIEKFQKNLDELTGEEKALLKQLETEWGCKTLSQAKTKLENLKKEIEDLDQQMEDKSQQIEKYFQTEE